MKNYVFILFFVLLPVQAILAQDVRLKLHSQRFSDRDLLGLGDPVTRLANMSAPVQFEPATDTLRILAIRVDFQEDDNLLTTGNGKFELAPNAEKSIDVPPHGLTYFDHQLQALSSYFRSVSRSKLILEFDVYPKDPVAAYTVTDQMSFYVPAGDEALLDQRLAEFLEEAFEVADASGDIDFSLYDIFIIFHAGVGGDFSFDFDPTPQDMPSVFLNFSILKEQIGNNDPTYQGVSVNGGASFVRDGIILPETQTQEGFEIGLLGTMTIMLGSQLGLPILFNPDNGRSGIGIFGLMDQGSGNFFGLLPAQPCAWSRVFLGWETPSEVLSGADLSVAATLADNENKIYKIPIDTKEYFLIENRNRDPNRDEIALGQDANGTRVEFHWDENGQRLIAEAAIGVITQVDEYDFGLPGSGLLIWHIDERVIASNFADNRVNADPEHRGVDLEEADGAQDIGQFYGFLSPGFGSENGVIEDMFWRSNKINMLVNNPEVDPEELTPLTTPVEFTPFTTPRSFSNAGANTHIYLTDFSEPDSVMKFSVRNSVTQPGFPQISGAAGRFENAPIIADLGGDAKSILSASNSSTDIFVWHADGTKFIPNDKTVETEVLNGETQAVPAAIFASPPGSAAFSPAVAHVERASIVVVSTDQVVAAYGVADGNSDGAADSLFLYQSTDPITTPPLVDYVDGGMGFQAVVGTENGDLLVVHQNGNGVLLDAADDKIAGLALFLTNQVAFTSATGEVGLVDLGSSLVWKVETDGMFAIPPVVADLDRDGNRNIICVSEAGTIFVFEADGSLRSGFPIEANITRPSAIAVGDLDDDKYFDIVFSAGNRIYAFNQIGTLLDNFPIRTADSEIVTATSAAPILTDLNDDDIPEVIVGTSENKLVAFYATGDLVAGFPLSAGGAINSTPFVMDLEDDGDADLAVASDDGFVYVWDLPNLFSSSSPWLGLFGDAEHSNSFVVQTQVKPPSGRLMPSDLVYNYPNPTEGNQTTIRYKLNESAQVRIRIFDLAGEFVDELVGPGFARANNEVVWRLDNIESGVYLARVEAQGSSSRDVTIVKIAVVK